jgi:hypothetical protein
VQFEKPVHDLDAAIEEARFALSIEKAAPPTVDGTPVGGAAAVR